MQTNRSTQNSSDASTKGALESLLEQTTKKQYAGPQLRQKRMGVIYTRVSSQEQAENNSSLQIQLKLCKEYAQRMGIQVKEFFGGTYESAKTDGRKEFQRMLQYVKNDKEVAFIIVYNYDRFSRTGPAAAQLSEELRRTGVMVKSISQDIDSSTPSGRLQENFFHLFNHYDNDQRSNRTSVNTREIMLKGYWPYATPMGYKNLKPKHRACDHQYIITEEGELIKKAFNWKAEGALTNKEIIERLKVRGLRLTEKNFRWVMSNPFYAGYVTGSLLKGALVKGMHPALIDLKTFLKANDMLQAAVNSGIAKEHKKEDLPLKVFAIDEGSGAVFTGYRTKGIWYYKTRGKGLAVNVRASQMNERFEALLKNFEYRNEYRDKLEVLIKEKLKEKLSDVLEENIQLKKQLSETKSLLEKIEERFVLGEITKAMYEKYAGKYMEEVGQIEGELQKNAFDSSNLENAVKKGLQIAGNISKMWASSNFDGKRRLQYLVFPEGVSYSKENDRVRTKRVNELFRAIASGKRILEQKETGDLEEDHLLSDSVPRTGFIQA